MPRKKNLTRRPSYGRAVQWIADNDSPGDDESVPRIAEYISTLLVADLFGARPVQVAIDVVRTRHGKGRFARRAPGEPDQIYPMSPVLSRWKPDD